MSPLQIPGPIPAAIQAQIKQHLRAALDLLKPFHLDLTGADRQQLGLTGMGPESMPFAGGARRLMTNFPDIMPRSFTDADIAAYGERLDTVTVCQDLKADAQAVVSTLHNLDVAAGSGLMATARLAYKAGQSDGGRTPGVEPIIGEMGERFARSSAEDDSTDPKS